jgi:hypothetical protein
MIDVSIKYLNGQVGNNNNNNNNFTLLKFSKIELAHLEYME